MVYKTNIDELAAAMEDILNDDSYRSVFERPQIKMASAEEPKPKAQKNAIESAYEQLVEASQILEGLGLVKSSELALEAVYTLLSEAGTECKCSKDCDKCKCAEKDGDCKCTCLDDKLEADSGEEKEKKEETQDVKPGEDKPGDSKPPWLNKGKDKDKDEDKK